MGWRSIMIDELPHWVPPEWVDPKQKPKRNTMHDRTKLIRG
jgi:hypothetical protein